MIKSSILCLIFTILLTANSFSAGSSSSGGDGASMKSNYEKAVSHIKKAKKFEKKEKLEKANKEYAKAQKLLLKSNKKKPNINLLWKLAPNKNGSFLILDLEIEGISLVSSQKAEAVSILRKNRGNFDTLLNKMTRDN